MTLKTALHNTAFRVTALAAIGSGLIAGQGLNVKTGQWDTTTTINLGGGAGAPALPPGALDRLPPDQRARIGAQLKASQGRTSTSTRCVTKEDVAKGFQPANLPTTCRYNLTVSTATQQKMTVTCDTDKGKNHRYGSSGRGGFGNHQRIGAVGRRV